MVCEEGSKQGFSLFFRKNYGHIYEIGRHRKENIWLILKLVLEINYGLEQKG